MTSSKPLPGTNLLQLRTWVGDPIAAGPARIERVVLICDFASPLAEPYNSQARDISERYGVFPAPWALNERVAVAFQVPQPGSWGPGLEVARGEQKIGLQITVSSNGTTEIVEQMADGSDRFTLDWTAPRDYSLDARVDAADGAWRLAVALV